MSIQSHEAIERLLQRSDLLALDEFFDMLCYIIRLVIDTAFFFFSKIAEDIISDILLIGWPIYAYPESPEVVRA